MDPVWTHPVSGGTLWVGNRHFSREALESAAISLVVSAAEPPAFLPDWVAQDRRHHAFLFADEARLPDAARERVAVDALVDALEEGLNVLVHCKGGLNRSPYLAVRALVALGEPAVTAVERLRQRRSPRVLGNTTFLGALVPRHEKERLARERRTSWGKRS